MFEESDECTIVLPEECLGYGPVVPFLACRFALCFRMIKKGLETVLENSLLHVSTSLARERRDALATETLQGKHI